MVTHGPPRGCGATRYLRPAVLVLLALVVQGALLGFLLGGGRQVSAQGGTWTATGSMSTPRYLHTATLLPSGKVLVAGGNIDGSTITASAELYDPAMGIWTYTGNLSTGRAAHTATLLPNGKVLVAGGRDGSNAPLASAELYDPVMGTWSATGSMSTRRGEGHIAIRLPNGKVLVAGGACAPPTAGNCPPGPDGGRAVRPGDGYLERDREHEHAPILPHSHTPPNRQGPSGWWVQR